MAIPRVYRIDLAPGQILFAEGDPPSSAFLIEEGRLRITTMRDHLPVVLGDLGPRHVGR